MKPLNMQGLLAAPFTPMRSNGDVNEGLIPDLVEHLVEKGIKGVYINGSTGEGLLLTEEERLGIVEKYITAATGRLKIIVNVTHTSLRTAQRLARHAAQSGADAVSSFAPFIFRPALPTIVRYLAELGSAAPEMPFYLYYFPFFGGMDFTVKAFLEEAESRMPWLAGVKFTHENVMDYQLCLRHGGGKFEMIPGRDEMVLSFLAAGAKSAVGSTFNYNAPLFISLFDEYRSGNLDRARELQAISSETIEILIKFGGGIIAGKAKMKILGWDMGPCRLPLRTLDDSEVDAMKKELRRTAFFDWV